MSKDYRRRPEHQALYNSKEWQDIKRYTFTRTGGLCERCIEEGKSAGVHEGYITPGVDCHHIVPWETGRTMEEVKRLFYDRNNIRLLCIPCHIKTHQEMRSHKADKVAENKKRSAERRASWLDPNYEQNNNGTDNEGQEGQDVDSHEDGQRGLPSSDQHDEG